MKKKKKKKIIEWKENEEKEKIRFVGFYGISTFEGYFTPNQFL